MKIYRAEIHGHRIEVRRGEFGGEYVVLDGRLVSRRPLAGWLTGPGHHFDITDEKGAARHVEVRIVQPSLGIGTVRALISVDGVERCRIEPTADGRPPSVCSNCGYNLVKLPPVNGEVRCPECGRHTAVAMLEE